MDFNQMPLGKRHYQKIMTVERIYREKQKHIVEKRIGQDDGILRTG